ncbi:dnaJ homolog subfamily C member 4 isoform X2 [Anabrus simplex]|uniref:dnaJ homolog subfamily C member 4 isoform X2 n=1 Tax=Anabrus simplex TaxID=316456 RepID=UPI0035A27849
MQSLIYNLLSTSIRNVFSRNIHTGRCLFQTHYDVLKLPRSCTPQEIRSSFIKLSKEYHPDKNTKDDNRHALFVRLNEAYSVLSRPESRKEYDLSLIPNRATSVLTTATYATHRVRPFRDPSFWENRDKSNIYYDRPYYGIKGVQKMSNTWIVFLCFIFTAIGVGLQVLLINQSWTCFSRLPFFFSQERIFGIPKRQ